MPRRIDALLAGMEPVRAPEFALMPRSFIQVTIPHRKPRGLHFQRQNGNLTLTMVGHPEHGLPYGKIPRLLLAWITRQAKRTNTREIKLPTTQASLLRELGCVSSGGQNGSITTLRNQAVRLATATVHFDWKSESGTYWQPYHIASGMRLWSDRSQNSCDGACWIELDPKFYEAVMESVIPLDFTVLLALRSPLAIDLYAWLTYRVYRLRREQLIPWPALQAQFGSDYSQRRFFRRAAITQLKHIYKYWPELRVTPEPAGLRLRKCCPHMSPSPATALGGKHG